MATTSTSKTHTVPRKKNNTAAPNYSICCISPLPRAISCWSSCGRSWCSGCLEKVKVGDFLFEREGRYKPDAKEIQGLQRIDKIDFSGNFHVANKPSKTNMILIKSGDLVISCINVAKGALGVYHGDADVTATMHYSSYTFDESKVSVEFFKRFLKSPIFIQLLREQVKSCIKTEIKPKHLLPLEIMLPDKDVQLFILSPFQRIENEDA